MKRSDSDMLMWDVENGKIRGRREVLAVDDFRMDGAS